jgi:hypothetical protein
VQLYGARRDEVLMIFASPLPESPSRHHLRTRDDQVAQRMERKRTHPDILHPPTTLYDGNH